MAEFEVVMDKLNGFETADEIADYFRDYGIKAVPKSNTSCAISKFVQQETGSIITTSSSYVAKWNVTALEQKEELSDAARKFVANFDLRKYPYLEIS